MRRGLLYGLQERFLRLPGTVLWRQPYRVPNATVVFLPPHYQERYFHPEGITNGQIAEAILHICPTCGFEVYDCYRLNGICHENLRKLTEDGCHWNDLGHALVGKNWRNFSVICKKHVAGADVGIKPCDIIVLAQCSADYASVNSLC